MKFLILLFLFGAVSCFPQAPCTVKELNECTKDGNQSELLWETVQEVEKGCKVNDCVLDFIKRCPDAEITRAIKKTIHEKLRRVLCDTQSIFRKKYFDNIKCLNKVMSTHGEDCKSEAVASDRYCEVLIQSFQCEKNIIAKMCGQDAVDVYAAIDTRFDMFDCPQPQ